MARLLTGKGADRMSRWEKDAILDAVLGAAALVETPRPWWRRGAVLGAASAALAAAVAVILVVRSSDRGTASPGSGPAVAGGDPYAARGGGPPVAELRLSCAPEPCAV